MQREQMIALADKLISIGEEIKRELINYPCTIYYNVQSGIGSQAWSTWKTDEEVVEWCEENKITKWWR